MPVTMPAIHRLLFAGEAIVDIGMRLSSFPQSGAQSGAEPGAHSGAQPGLLPGMGVLADSSRIAVGGGFNVMAAAARQGLPVLYAGAHGTGPWGDLVRKALSAEGIAVLRAPDPLRDTGFAVALASDAGERAYVTQLGAESVRPRGCMDEVPVMPGDAVYISGFGLIPAGSEPGVGKQVEGEQGQGERGRGEPVTGERGLDEKVMDGTVVDGKVVDERVLDEPVIGARGRGKHVPGDLMPGDLMSGDPMPGERKPGEWVLGDWAASLPPGVLLFLDPGHLAARIPAPLLDRVLPRVDWLSCTAAEATALTGAADPETAARALLSRTRNVMVRLGPSGCLLSVPNAGVSRDAGVSEAARVSGGGGVSVRAGVWGDPGVLRDPGVPGDAAHFPGHADVPGHVRVARDAGVSGVAVSVPVVAGFVHIPAPAVTPVDTTGAGDTHAGAFLAALADGLTPESAARRANAAAALSVTRPGPATAPTRAELDTWLS